jgi:PIN domain nuclease of toxin-antitoxin system
MPETATSPVLDASAFLAYLGNESGADVVADAIASGAIIVTVNLAEALSTLATRGKDPAAVVSDLTERGLLDGAVAVEPFTTADAIAAATLRPLTKAAGLSLADRACLAVARRLSTSVLTADLAWSGLALGVDVHAIRDSAE